MLPSRFLAGAVIWGVLAGLADATDQPISGLTLRIQRKPSGKERLVFSAKDPTFLFPSLASDDAPTQAGLSVEIFSTAEPSGASVTAPATGVQPGWQVSTGHVAAYRFRRGGNGTAVTPVRRAVLRQGRGVKVVLDEAGLALAASQGAVGIRIKTGTLRSCARFAGAAVVTDRPGLFVGSNAPAAALSDCATTSLLGLPPTPPTCGDGEINGTEACDGADLGVCGQYGGGCRPPGVDGECDCCQIPNLPSPCCNPSSISIPSPEGVALCIATRCDPPFDKPPFDCGDNTCQPDGSCCTPTGGTCGILFGRVIPLNPCCDGSICAGANGSFGGSGVSCCVPAPGACTVDTDCCSGHCDAGSCAECTSGPLGPTCCLFSPLPCVSDADCCSQHCEANLCCNPAGSPCLSDEGCCSGHCNAGTPGTCAP